MPRNNADFHGVTFNHTSDKYGARIEAVHPEHGVVGHMLLHPLISGKRKVRNIVVNNEFQRKGIATGMWNYAMAQGLKPKHSADRTDAGDAWARSVSKRLPKRIG
jgi:hypothetical protein